MPHEIRARRLRGGVRRHELLCVVHEVVLGSLRGPIGRQRMLCARHFPAPSDERALAGALAGSSVRNGGREAAQARRTSSPLLQLLSSGPGRDLARAQLHRGCRCRHPHAGACAQCPLAAHRVPREANDLTHRDYTRHALGPRRERAPPRRGRPRQVAGARVLHWVRVLDRRDGTTRLRDERG